MTLVSKAMERIHPRAPSARALFFWRSHGKTH
nr:MAG TPA: hypothetical protein [Caudoviricetes sp.]